MYTDTLIVYRDAMRALARQAEALAAAERALVGRLVKIEIDFLGVAVLHAAELANDLRAIDASAHARAEALHDLLAEAVRLKVEALGLFVLDEAKDVPGG